MAERKGKKLRRCTAASKNYYKCQLDITEKNAKKRIGKRIRQFPEDMQARKRCETLCGEPVLAGHLANITRKARRRVAARASELGV